jgi:hypothetical protein
MLELSENTKEKVTHNQLKFEVEFNVNRPFFFLVELDHDILAMGRIKDPNWYLLVFPMKIREPFKLFGYFLKRHLLLTY